MKKNFIIFFLILIFIPNFVFASAIEIDNLDSVVNVKDNGDYNIRENFTFSNDENLNGVYRTIFYGESNGITNLKISSHGKDFVLDNNAKNGDSYKYSLDDSNNNLKIKIYMPWNKLLDVNISYTLNNAAIKGVDTGFISYNFMSNIETPIKSFTGTIYADDVDFTNLLVKADGNNSNVIKNNGSIVFTASDIGENEYLSINAEIPLEAIKYSTNDKDLYLSDLENFNKTNNTNEKINFITLPLVAIIYVFFMYFYKKLKRDFVDTEELGHIMPLSPAEASSLIFGNNNSYNFVFATLLDFETRGYLTIKEEEILTKKSKKKSSNYIYTKTNKDISNLSNSEKYLYNMFFENSDSFSSEDLNDERKKSSSKYYKKFTNYLDVINKDLIDKGLKLKSYTNIAFGIFAIFLSIIFFILGIVGLVTSNLLGILVIIISIFLFILSFYYFNIKTSLGKEQHKYYYNLYKELSKTSEFNDYNEDNKNKLIIYAIAFGLSFSKVNKLSDTFNTNRSNFIPLYWIGIHNSNMHSQMNKSFVGNESGVSSFGGGTSSGGSGSTGGGSAGGF